MMVDVDVFNNSKIINKANKKKPERARVTALRAVRHTGLVTDPFSLFWNITRWFTPALLKHFS